MIINGKKTSINASQKKLYDFLSDFNNFEHLMPEQIVNWKSDKEHCSFTIKGMADISLKYSVKEPYRLLELVPDGKSPVNFNLVIRLQPDELNEQKTTVRVDVDADLNPMMALIAKRPFEDLANSMTDRLNKYFEKENE
jgi:carbon monoxide dehydrogenase subunit G